MKVLLICGHPYSELPLAYGLLNKAGLGFPRSSENEINSPADFYNKIFEAHDIDLSKMAIMTPISLGKVWENLAVDLFLGNLDQKYWGWEDPRSVWLLNFWKELDAQVNFVLVYSAPEFVLSNAMIDINANIGEIEPVLTSWMVYHQEMLRFYNRNPDRCVLVNAETIIHHSKTFIDKINKVFSMELISPSGDQLNSVGSNLAIGNTLAKILLNNNNAYALYSELESVADITCCNTIQTNANRYQAWEEFAALLVQVDKAKTDISKNIQYINQLKAEQVKLTTDYKFQLHQANEELELCFLKIQQLTQARDEQAKLAAERQTQIIPSSQQTELIKENELLLMQLHQVQEELEHYFIQCQEVSSNKNDGTSEILSLINNFWKKHQPSEIIIDFRDQIEGSNWYYAEFDGTWAGPSNISTVKLPPLRKGRYELYMDVVDAMASDIITGIEISLNGVKLQANMDGTGYPIMIYSELIIDGVMEQEPIWEFKFKFPRVISPAQHGSNDDRYLAVRVRKLKLRLV
jgi:hypothetical protein